MYFRCLYQISYLHIVDKLNIIVKLIDAILCLELKVIYDVTVNLFVFTA